MVRAGVPIVVGAAITIALTNAVFETYATPLGLVLLIGPAWMLLFCLASTPDDFDSSATFDRSRWLGIIPWLFVAAPLVLPTMVMGVLFVRDARADGGRFFYTQDRMRPGDHADHHWPE